MLVPNKQWLAEACAMLLLGCLACAAPAKAEQRPNRMSHEQLEFQGARREYWVHVPRNSWLAEMPLLLVLHDENGSATQMQRDTGWNKISAEHGFLVVYPEGLHGAWNDGRENPDIRSQRDAVDDVGFLAQLIADLATRHKIDRSRIYVVGGQDGALMAFRLACERADLFAAVAGVAGAVTERLTASCRPESIPVLLVNGTKDPIVPFFSRGGRAVESEIGRIYSAADSARFFARRNGCSIEPTRRTLPQVDIQSVTAVEEFTFSGCPDAEVMLYAVVGGRHHWPGARASSVGQVLSDRVFGKSGYAISATDLIWKFFSKQRKQ